MHVEQIDFISIPTRDPQRAIAWYRDVLLLPVSDRLAAANGGSMPALGVAVVWASETSDGRC